MNNTGPVCTLQDYYYPSSRVSEDFIQEYLDVANYSDFPDDVLIDFFCDGINQPLKSKLICEGPRSSLSQFLDYALLCVGSSFTVGVAEVERDTALNCVIAATPEHTHKMAAIAEPVHKMAATTTTLCQVIAVSHESSQVTVDLRESSQITVDRHESSQVTVDRHESGHITADLPESLHISAIQPESLHVSAHQPVSSRLCRAARVYYTQRFKVSPSSSLSGVQREDAPLVSARAAGIPKSTHFSPPVPELIPLSEALPMMGIALCCIWAAYTTSELPQVMAPAAASPVVAAYAAEPPEAAVLVSSLCMVVAPKNVLSTCHVAVKETVTEHYLSPGVTTVEPPEVAASAAEPPEVSVVPSCESLLCPVTAMEAICDSLSCPVTAMEAVCESLSCPVTAMEAVCEPLSCPVTATEVAFEHMLCSEPANVSNSELPVSVKEYTVHLNCLPWNPKLWMHRQCCLSLLSLCCLSLFPPDLRLCHGFLPGLLSCGGLLLQSGGLLLRSGSLLPRRGGLLLGSGGLPLRRGGLLLRSGGFLLHLLRPGGLRSRLLRPGGLRSRPLRPGGLQFHRLCPGFPLCLSLQSLHLHMDLALRPSPCSTSAPPPSWIALERLEAALWGGGSVTNPVCGLPPDRHQRSLTHHMDSCTTLLLNVT